jgi:hypothetical protein
VASLQPIEEKQLRLAPAAARQSSNQWLIVKEKFRAFSRYTSASFLSFRLEAVQKVILCIQSAAVRTATWVAVFLR